METVEGVCQLIVARQASRSGRNQSFEISYSSSNQIFWRTNGPSVQQKAWYLAPGPYWLRLAVIIPRILRLLRGYTFLSTEGGACLLTKPFADAGKLIRSFWAESQEH
jgi:hypothetical protein